MHLYIVTHKKFSCPKINGYIPIQVGKSFTNVDLNYLSDDTQYNIANKNNTYCELTALYWMWKNDSTNKNEIIGLCHYRRFFTKNMFSKNPKFFPKEDDALNALENYDIILPKKVYLRSTVSAKYSLNGSGVSKDLRILQTIISEKYSEYLLDYEEVMNSREQYFWNMFVCKRNVMDEYCKWLFKILEDLENRVDITNYTKQQARIFGFISERLLNVWVKHKKLRIKEYYVINTEKKTLDNIKFNVGVLLKKRKL